MKKTIALIKKFMQLAEGQTLPESTLRGDCFQRMKEDGILLTITHGSRKSLRATETGTFLHYLESQYDIRNLEETLRLLQADEADRASQVAVTGDSKFSMQRTFHGFLVNSYQPIPATLNGESFTIFPQDGSFLFISDYQSLHIPDDVIVVGMENAENFRFVKRQQQFFDRHFPPNRRLLFVSRYPQNQHNDLIKWLNSVPNQYVHFGDLDLAGIAIYQNEYFRYLGKQCSFLIPEDYEQRISKGSRKRYDDQLQQFGKMKIEDNRIANILACVHRDHRGYDQEGFISDDSIKE